jgi:hypothetical protein
MGYGGRDDHINAVLRSAGDHWGDKLRAFVCNRALPEQLADDARFAETVVPALHCLGRGGLGLGRDRTSFDTGPLSVNRTAMLTLDGRFERHVDAIRHFFDS